MRSVDLAVASVDDPALYRPPADGEQAQQDPNGAQRAQST